MNNTSKKVWIRNCPKCNKQLKYFHRGHFNRDLKNKAICNICYYSRGKYTIGIFNRPCPECAKIIIYHRKDSLDRANKYNRLCNSCKIIGTKHPFYGTSGTRMGKFHTKETKRKMRLSAINRIKGGCHPNYNPIACKYLDELNLKFGWNIQHAENGGEFHIKELGYWVYGYDKKRNIVVEYDEKHHNHLKIKQRDALRAIEIKNLLGCKFYRFDARKKILYEI